MCLQYRSLYNSDYQAFNERNRFALQNGIFCVAKDYLSDCET